jgi:hypothetical protein
MWVIRAIGSPRFVGALAVGGLLALFSLTACVEWTTDPQGHPQSIGLPGVPLWQTQTLAGSSPSFPGKLGSRRGTSPRLGGYRGSYHGLFIELALSP